MQTRETYQSGTEFASVNLNISSRSPEKKKIFNHFNVLFDNYVLRSKCYVFLIGWKTNHISISIDIWTIIKSVNVRSIGFLGGCIYLQISMK